MSKRIVVSFATAILTITSAHAQDRQRPDVLPQVPTSQQSTSMQRWGPTYEPETPREYVRRRAQEKADARKARIEGMSWLGYSLSRPTTTALPFMGHAPTWGAVRSYGYWSYPYWSHPVNFMTPGVP